MFTLAYSVFQFSVRFNFSRQHSHGVDSVRESFSENSVDDNWHQPLPLEALCCP